MPRKPKRSLKEQWECQQRLYNQIKLLFELTVKRAPTMEEMNEMADLCYILSRNDPTAEVRSVTLERGRVRVTTDRKGERMADSQIVTNE